MAGDVSELPRLREDLRLSRAGPGLDGRPQWVIQDPLSGRYFQLTFEMFQLFSQWNSVTSAEQLGHRVFEKFGRIVEGSEIEAVLHLCHDSNFFHQRAQDWKSYHTAALRRPAWYMSLLHNYIFFKVPLFSPDRFLRLMWPVVRLLFSRAFFALSVLAGLIGLYLVSRQWESFINSFPYFFTFAGICTSALAVMLVKSLHELGHGFMAFRYGCRTSTMGLAFMALAPMLYSDVTDAWKLQSRHQRMMIDMAGILTELVLGMWCLLIWPFLPDGPLRSAVFVTATVSWVMSLFINLNPMTRFDGYFILSDLLGMPNLQSRAFAHMRSTIRRILFGSEEQDAERFSTRRSISVLAIGVATIVYRFFLYIGIAVLVYHFFIKALGILMLAAEIYYFFFMPVWQELKVWWHMRGSISRHWQSYVTASLAVAGVVACLLPISRSVSVPALLEPQEFQHLFPEVSGQLVRLEVKNGQTVSKGDTLFVVEARSIEQERQIAEAQLQAARLRLDRVAADAQDLREKKELEELEAQLLGKLKGLGSLDDKLVVRAPFDGVVVDIPAGLHAGKWVARMEQLGLLVGGQSKISRGYADADTVARLETGAEGLFIPDSIEQPALPLTLRFVAKSSSDAIELPALTSLHGGAIAVNPDKAQKLIPAQAQYMVRAESGNDAGLPPAVSRGVLRFAAAPESLAARAYRNVLRVLVKEAGA